MGTDKNERIGAKKSKAAFGGFESTWVEFEPADVQEMRKHETVDIEQLFYSLSDLAESSWKISLSYSEHYSGYVASASMRDKTSDYAKRTFIVTHVDADRAVQGLVYALGVLIPRGKFIEQPKTLAKSW